MRKLRSAAQCPRFVKLWLLPVWVLMGFSSACIALLPFRRISPFLGRPMGAVSVRPSLSHAAAERALQIGTTIALAGKYAPFRSDCLPQAMVAVVMCRVFSLPYALHVGCKINKLADGEVPLAAHAWVVSGPVVISGGRHSARVYQTVACWIAPEFDSSEPDNSAALDPCDR